MSNGVTLGDAAYRTRAEALAGEVGRWATGGGHGAEEIEDIAAAVRELLAVGWLDESFGEVEHGELRDAIEAHNAWARERRGAHPTRSGAAGSTSGTG